MIALTDFVPSGLELGGFAGVLGAGLVMLLVGRLLLAGRATPELQVLAGWGAISFVLTLWGVATTTSMRWPLAAFVVLAIIALALPRSRPGREDWLALWRIMVLALPIWAIMIAAHVSLPDTYTNFLPNSVYLWDHGFFPADDRIASFAVWPAFPYNVQFATLLASFALPQYPPNAATLFDIMVLLLAGLLFARLLRPTALGTTLDAGFRAAPSWAACAGGILLVTAFNPGFVPRYHFTPYTEPTLMVGVAFIGWLLARMLGRLAEGWHAGRDLWLLSLLLVAFVGIKQLAVVLAGGLLLGAAILILADRRIHRVRAIGGLILASLPMLLIYAVWRLYVGTHFKTGELLLLPSSMWQFDILPGTLASIAAIIAGRPFYFVFVALALVLAVRLTAQRGLTLSTRLLLLTAVIFVVYNVFLLLIYVISMGPVAGEDAHSYFRYMTHLALFVELSLVAAARAFLLARVATKKDHSPAAAPWQRYVSAAAIVGVLLMPIAFVKFLRFDLPEPQRLAWTLVHELDGVVKDGDRLALILPGDNGSVSLMLRAAMTLTPPRRAVDFYPVPAGQGLEAALAKGYRSALISCDPRDGSAKLMEYDGTAWRVAQTWPHRPARGRWGTILSWGPFCRG
ncbi:MAG: hypothetical protein JWL84_4294 [Rhodospirillales bacterium]|nr:hypothetical protein [Rhodospirillales bacterium]